MADIYRQRFTIEYDESIMEKATTSDGKGHYARRIGKRRMRAEVEVVLDLAGAAGKMGRRACTSKGGKCRDGFVTVKRTGFVQEIGRTMDP